MSRIPTCGGWVTWGLTSSGGGSFWEYAAIGNFARQTLDLSSFRRWKSKQSKAKVCASFKNLSSQTTGENKQLWYFLQRLSAVRHVCNPKDLGRLTQFNHLSLRKITSKTSKHVNLSRRMMVHNLLWYSAPMSQPLERWLLVGLAWCLGRVGRGEGLGMSHSRDS